MRDEFLNRGLMTIELLAYVLQQFNLGSAAQETFIDLMLKFDLCYQVDETASAPGTIGSERILQFPWFLTTLLPNDYENKWPVQVSCESYVICSEAVFHI